MAKENETTTKFKVDISDLVKGMQTAKRQIALANAEFKASTAGMDDWGKAADGVTAKLTQLDKTLSSQKTILSNLESQYELVATQMGADSKEAENLKIKIENQKASIGKTEKQINTYNQSLNSIVSESNMAESSFDKLNKTIRNQETELSSLKSAYASAVLEYGKGSKEAQGLASQISALSTDLAANKRSLSSASSEANAFDKSLDAVKDSADKAGDGFTILKGAVATFAGNLATQAVGAIKNTISSIAGLSSETKEFRQDMATLTTAFGRSGFSAGQATKTWKELYGIFGEDDRAVEAGNNIARMSKNQKDLDKWVRITTGVWGTYQDALPVESLSEAAGETAKTGKVTGTLADALNWSSDASKMFSKYMSKDVVTAEDAFNVALSKCSSEQERQTLITNTMTKLYGKAGDQYNKTSKSVTDANKATADLTLQQAKMGETIEPVVTMVKGGFSRILAKILQITQGVDFQAFSKKIKGGFDYFINNIIPAIMSGLGWIVDNSSLVIASIAGIGAGFVAWKVSSIINGVVKSIKAFQLANEGATVAQWAMNLAMEANPVGIIITAIVALIAIFVVLWNKCDAFRNFFINMWNVIKDAFAAVADFFVAAWDNAVRVVKTLFNAWLAYWKFILVTIPTWIYDYVIKPVIDFFVMLWNGIVAIFEPVTGFFATIFNGVYQVLKTVVGIAIGIVQGCWAMVCRIFQVAGSWFKTTVIDPIAKFFTGLWNGLKTGALIAWTAIKTAFNMAASWFNTTIIKPVTTLFSGLWSGFKNGATTAWNTVKSVFSKVADFFGSIFSKAWQKVKDVFSAGGKIFAGIKDGIVSAFKTVVNAIIRGINKVVKIPFNFINGALNKIHDISFLGISPFKKLWSKDPIHIPQIPELYQGGVLKKGQTGYLEGNGDEAVVPLEKNTGWLDKVADRIVAKGGMTGNRNQSVTNNYSYDFNQTNNSPKPLSRLEIYRQTKNIVNYGMGV